MNSKRVEMVRQLVMAGGIARPDELSVSEMSAGAGFLDTVAVSLKEAIEYGRIVPDREFCADGEYRSDVLNEIASESISVSTHTKWLAFVDLCAYEDNWSDGEFGTTMGSMADSRLAHIAYLAMQEWLAEHFDTED
jgi:hypothetical protein